MSIFRRLFFLIVLFWVIMLPVSSQTKQETKTNQQFKTVDDFIKLSNQKFAAGSYQEAIRVALQALTAAEKTNIGLDLAKANLQVGKMHYFNQEPSKNTLFYYKKARLYIYANNIDSLKQQINYNIGTVYVEIMEVDSAKFYLKKVFEGKNAFKNYAILSKTYSVLAEMHFKHDPNLPLAKKYVDKALKYGALSNNYQIETFALIKKGIYYNCIKDYNNALICFNKAKEIYEVHNDVEDRMYVYKLIAINKACKANPEIYDAFYKYLDLKDSLFKAESTKKTAEYKVLYETEKKDREIKIKTAEAETQKSRNSIQLLLFLGFIMIIAFVAVFVFFQQKNRQKAKLLMETNRLEKLRFKAVIESEEKERKRIAEELHDGLGQLLSTAKMNVASLDDAVAQSDEEDKVVFQTSLNLIDEAVSEVRNISHNLMPGALIKLGLIPAISDLVKKINTSGKLNVDFDYDPNFEKLNETSEIAIFRIVQEILNNSIKHSQAKNMTIELKKMGTEILLLITDNGIGLDVSNIEKSKGIGWKNIHSRVAMLNGTIDIQSIKNSGTKIRITLNTL